MKRAVKLNQYCFNRIHFNLQYCIFYKQTPNRYRIIRMLSIEYNNINATHIYTPYINTEEEKKNCS